QPHPPRVADRPVEPVAPLFARLPRRQEFGQRRARVLGVLEQHEPALGPAAVVSHCHPVAERLPRGSEARHRAADGEPRAERETREERGGQECNEKRKRLVGERAIGVEPHHCRRQHTDQGERAGAGEAAALPVLRHPGPPERAKEQAPHAAPDPGYAGTGKVLTISSTMLCAVTPVKRACESTTIRCAITGSAISWTCSGVTKSPPSSRARAWAAFMSASDARGLAPRDTPAA